MSHEVSTASVRHELPSKIVRAADAETVKVVVVGKRGAREKARAVDVLMDVIELNFRERIEAGCSCTFAAVSSKISSSSAANARVSR